MHRILGEMLDKDIVVCINTILIYTKTKEKHTRLVKWVLQKLLDTELCTNINKCQFYIHEVEFIRFIIGSSGISISTNKVEQILDWQSPRNILETQKFLGFANFYQRFIQGYSSITFPIMQLTCPRNQQNWTDQCQWSFEKPKKAFTEAPILTYFTLERAKMIETDASDLAKGGILNQLELDRKWH